MVTGPKLPITPITTQKENTRVAKAKKVKIESLLPVNIKIKSMGNKLGILCPFHKETNPSCFIYPDTNTWHCFAGCGGGDAISFYMCLKGVDFRTAVEEMTR